MRNKLLSAILLFIILPVIFLLNSTSIYSNIRNGASAIFTPVLEVSHFIFFNLSEGMTRISEYAEIYRTHEQIRNELISLRQEKINVEELKAENERLVKLLNFKKAITEDNISAQLVGRDVSPWSNWIMLNIGYTDKASPDMPIIAPGGLVGRIVSVGNNSSRSILIIDHQSNVSAIVQESRDMGVVKGNGNGILTMTYLNLNATVNVGDTVVTSGLGGIYPKGIPLGAITVIGTENNGLHLFAKVKPFVDFTKIEEVLCLVRSK